MPRHRSLVPSLALGTVCLLEACAPLPAVDGVAPRLRSIEQFQPGPALQAPAQPWPTAQWWTAYGDPQLDALMAEALAGSPDLAAASTRVAQADALSQLAGAARQPQLGLNASVSEEKLSYNHLMPAAYLPQGVNDYGRATLDLRWQLDFWGKHRAGLAAATTELQAQQAELAQARLTLASGVASAYAGLSLLHAHRDTAERALAIRQQSVQLMRERLSNGLETRAGLREAEARRAEAEGGLLAVDEQIALQRHRLAALLGEGPDRGQAITRPQLQLNHAFGLPANLPAHLLGRRPDVVAARLMAEAQDHRVAQQRAAFYPDVNLSAFVGVQALGLNMLSDAGSRIAGVGPAISLPLFSGGQLEGALRAAQAGQAERVARYNATVTRALQEVADSAVSLRALGPRLAKAQEASDAAAEAHRIALTRYQGGLATALDVLQAEDRLLGSLSALTELRARSLLLDIDLQRALGGGYETAAR